MHRVLAFTSIGVRVSTVSAGLDEVSVVVGLTSFLCLLTLLGIRCTLQTGMLGMREYTLCSPFGRMHTILDHNGNTIDVIKLCFSTTKYVKRSLYG